MLSGIETKAEEWSSIAQNDAVWKSRAESLLSGIKSNKERAYGEMKEISSISKQASSTLSLVSTNIAQTRDDQHRIVTELKTHTDALKKECSDKSQKEQELAALLRADLQSRQAQDRQLLELASRLPTRVSSRTSASQRRNTCNTRSQDGAVAYPSRVASPNSVQLRTLLPEVALIRDFAPGLFTFEQGQSSDTAVRKGMTAPAEFAILRLVLILLIKFVELLMRRLVTLAPSNRIQALVPYFLPDDMVLKDPLGRLHRLPLRFFDSWEMMKLHLKNQFEGLPGFQKVCNMEFTILDISNPHLAIGASQWRRVARPRGRFLMSMAFPEMALHGHDNAECIKCNSPLRRCGASGYICPSDICGVFIHTQCPPTPSSQTPTSSEITEEWLKAVGSEPIHPRPPETVYFLAARGCFRVVSILFREYFLDRKLPTDSEEDTEMDTTIDGCPGPTAKPYGPLTPQGFDGDTSSECQSQQRPQEPQNKGIEHFCSISVQSKTALYDAATKGDVALARDLLQDGCNINEVMGQFGVALNGALVSGHRNMLMFLLEKGASLFPPLHPRLSPICVAASQAHPQLVMVVLTRAALRFKDAPEYYQMSLDAALCAAIRRRDHILTEALLGFGANPLVVQENGQSALEMSVLAATESTGPIVLMATLLFDLSIHNIVSITELTNVFGSLRRLAEKAEPSSSIWLYGVIALGRRISKRVLTVGPFFHRSWRLALPGSPHPKKRKPLPSVYDFDPLVVLH